MAVAGDNGIVLDCDDTACRQVHEDPAAFLYGIATDGEAIVAAGWAGMLLRGTAATGLAPVSTGTWRVFQAVDMQSGGKAFLSGLSGTFAVDEGKTP